MNLLEFAVGPMQSVATDRQQTTIPPRWQKQEQRGSLNLKARIGSQHSGPSAMLAGPVNTLEGEVFA
ncbi:hypothetical protein [Cupriavidus basilensis]|uniref:hypothetical protein n=1 Tax=Cupriavidus basilensis TaxID=68895 RepID=UPI00114649AA|nr:hypothetical protein [Cupriavidus basilensis]